MNRRRFLDASPAADVLPAPPPRAAVGDLMLVRATRRAMATTFEIAIPFGTPDAVAAAEDGLDLISDLEDQLTVYTDTSEVSRLNAAAADGAVPVESRLFDLLAFSAGMTRDTAGAFDIATGALTKVWGFYRREGRVPTPRERADALGRSGSRHLLLDADRQAVKFRRPGLEINLGAVGKGYALDRVAELLQSKWGVRSALLHGGGSSVRAVGTPPGQPRGWPVALRHPTDDTRTLGTVYLADRSLGTSATTFQYFQEGGRRYGHVLDPRTGSPARGTASATAIAGTAAAADALSTAFFVRGAAAAQDYCRSRPGLGAVVLSDEDPLAEREGHPTPLVAGLSLLEYDRPAARPPAPPADLSPFWD